MNNIVGLREFRIVGLGWENTLNGGGGDDGLPV